MVDIVLIAAWLFKYDLIFQIAFAFITFFISLSAFKVFWITKENQPKLFGIAFLLISLSYIASIFPSTINLYAKMILFILGLITLVYITLKINRPVIFGLLAILSLISIFRGCSSFYLFYTLTSLLLIWISNYYLLKYFQKKNLKRLLVLLAFLFLLFAQIHFLWLVNHGVYYVLGHFLEIAAYVLLSVNLGLMIKNG